MRCPIEGKKKNTLYINVFSGFSETALEAENKNKRGLIGIKKIQKDINQSGKTN